MSKASGYSSPKAMSRPGSPGPALGAGFDKNEDREALMMGPVGERRSIDKIDKGMDQAAPAAKDQSEHPFTILMRPGLMIVPPILSYCLASIMMTVVNKVCPPQLL